MQKEEVKWEGGIVHLWVDIKVDSLTTGPKFEFQGLSLTEGLG